MLRLSKSSGMFPKCLHIKNVKKLGNYPVGGGGFGDVWKGEIDGQLVCLKVVKAYFTSDVQQLLKVRVLLPSTRRGMYTDYLLRMQDYMREAIVWQQLRHPNLLPFLGMYYLESTGDRLALVSPWMDRGNLPQYLKATPRKDVDHQALVRHHKTHSLVDAETSMHHTPGI